MYPVASSSLERCSVLAGAGRHRVQQDDVIRSHLPHIGDRDTSRANGGCQVWTQASCQVAGEHSIWQERGTADSDIERCVAEGGKSAAAHTGAMGRK